ncbi:MAG: hypothetical protein OZSIB_4209 [Candidatus Ozemobacter sibiricus]|uniref:FecR protein domain-containing protein n=1 Tax=Candidatus Ozemobacter sibiricus TaxID=2268124 RepID=A0A367ZPG5_9BACT|nr:MAG: hypothetical protein OZSIB_4209 [Candidatus Ozemobacter sibiricus]
MNERPCPASLDFQAYVDDQLEAPARQQLEAHVRTCARCARDLERTRAFFADLQVVCAVGAGDLATPAQINRVMDRLARAHPERPASPRWRAWLEALGLSADAWRPLLAGATLLLLMVAGLAFYSAVPRRAPPTVAPSPTPTLAASPFTYTLSAPSRQYLLEGGGPGRALPVQGVLQTGRVYHLPPMGKLFVSYKSENRLELSQQAVFEVSDSGLHLRTGDLMCRLQKSGRDLVIHTPAGTITPVGTTFFVEVRPRSTRVTLEKGRVILRTPTETVSLERPGTLFMRPDGQITTHFEASDVSIRLPEGHLPGPRTLERPPQPETATSLREGY